MIEVPIFSTARHGGSSTTQLRLGAADVPRRVAAVARVAAVSARDAPAATRLRRGTTRAWRDPAQVASQWADAGARRPAAARASRARGDFWDVLASAGITLLVTREYEHLLVALARRGRPARGHATCRCRTRPGSPSTAARGVVHVASTRNPNQVFELAPVAGLRRAGRPRRRRRAAARAGALALLPGPPLPPRPGADRRRAARERGRAERGRPPRRRRRLTSASGGRDAIETRDGARLRAQLPAAQLDRRRARRCATRSSRRPPTRSAARRPGHLNFPVDRRGVVFSGAHARAGRARPDAAALGAPAPRAALGRQQRLRRGRRRRATGAFEPVARLPGWTRGLCFHGDVAFVGTSRVIPRFRALRAGPGRSTRSVCGVHAVDAATRRGARQPRLAVRQPDLRGRAGCRARSRTGFPFAAGAGARRGARGPLLRVRTRSTEGRSHEQRLPPADDRRDVRERRQHDPPLPRRPPAAVRLSVRVAARHAATSTTSSRSMFPVKYRWPVFALDATPAEDYHAIIDEEGKVRARTPHVSKFRAHAVRPLRRRARRASTASYVDADRALARRTTWRRSSAPRSTPGRTTGGAAARRSTSATARSSSSTPRRSSATCRSAHVLHVVRNPWSAYADTKKRPVPLSLADYMLGWTLNQYHALLVPRAVPGRLHIVRAEDVMARPARDARAPSAKRSASSAPDSLAHAELERPAPSTEVYPWGTIRDADAGGRTARPPASSAPAERDEIRQRAWQYLDVVRLHGASS